MRASQDCPNPRQMAVHEHRDHFESLRPKARATFQTSSLAKKQVPRTKVSPSSTRHMTQDHPARSPRSDECCAAANNPLSLPPRQGQGSTGTGRCCAAAEAPKKLSRETAEQERGETRRPSDWWYPTPPEEKLRTTATRGISFPSPPKSLASWLFPPSKNETE